MVKAMILKPFEPTYNYKLFLIIILYKCNALGKIPARLCIYPIKSAKIVVSRLAIVGNN